MLHQVFVEVEPSFHVVFGWGWESGLNPGHE
jgi:hypothetical protein